MYLPSELRRANINPWAQNSLSYLVSRYYQYPALVGSVRSCREGNYACARSRCSVMAGIGVFKYIARKSMSISRPSMHRSAGNLTPSCIILTSSV